MPPALEMCIYARTVFECKHHLWGRRLKLCAIGEAFRAGELPGDCALRSPHGLHSRRVTRRCDKCRALDRKVALTRAKLEECRAAFRERWPAYGAGGAGAEGVERLHVDGEGVETKGPEQTKGSERTKESARATLASSPRDSTARQITKHYQRLATIHER